MAYNELLADRIKLALDTRKVAYEAKNMMGGLCFMVNDKMCTGIVKDMLMARIDPEIYEQALQKKGCREMDFTGRSMKGYVFVEPNGIESDKDLNYWIQLCLDFNPKAKSSKSKAK